MDPREINPREKRKEREDNETEVGIRGEVRVIEPLAKGIGARAGRRGGKGGGEEGVNVGGREEREGRAVGFSKGGKGEGGRRRRRRRE